MSLYIVVFVCFKKENPTRYTFNSAKHKNPYGFLFLLPLRLTQPKILKNT